MPTQWAHGFYWALSDTAAPPPYEFKGNYPIWQVSTITPSLFGVIGAWLSHVWEEVQWWRRFRDRVKRLTPRQRHLWYAVLTTIEQPAFQAARVAVWETAHTPRFNRPESWIPYNRMLKASQGRAENMFRHVAACERTRALVSSTLQNTDCDLLVTLAYRDYTTRPWGPVDAA